MTTYYVSHAGDDYYNGLQAVWSSGQDGPFRTISHAFNQAGDGDIIYLLKTSGRDYVLENAKTIIGTWDSSAQTLTRDAGDMFSASDAANRQSIRYDGVNYTIVAVDEALQMASCSAAPAGDPVAVTCTVGDQPLYSSTVGLWLISNQSGIGYCTIASFDAEDPVRLVAGAGLLGSACMITPAPYARIKLEHLLLDGRNGAGTVDNIIKVEQDYITLMCRHCCFEGSRVQIDDNGSNESNCRIYLLQNEFSYAHENGVWLFDGNTDNYLYCERNYIHHIGYEGAMLGNYPTGLFSGNGWDATYRYNIIAKVKSALAGKYASGIIAIGSGAQELSNNIIYDLESVNQSRGIVLNNGSFLLAHNLVVGCDIGYRLVGGDGGCSDTNYVYDCVVAGDHEQLGTIEEQNPRFMDAESADFRLGNSALERAGVGVVSSSKRLKNEVGQDRAGIGSAITGAF